MKFAKLRCDVSSARISEFESGNREPDLIVLLRYSQMVGLHMETLVSDDLELPEKFTLLRAVRGKRTR